ncbi:MAG: transglycosylase SLT domain-containing protein [Chlamydiia bacterium]|nr:transglycosylase SLT domain-containing protein [Chlamydiia bacterium]
MSDIDDMIAESFNKHYGSTKRISYREDTFKDDDFINKPPVKLNSDQEEYKSTRDFSKNFTAEQYSSIVKKSKEWGKDPNALAGIILHESGGNTKARNKNSKATGLIQFMPETAKGLGTTIDEIYDMSFEQQLDLTGKYFRQHGKKWDEAKTATDLYSLVFYPAMVGKSDNYVLGGDKRSGIVAKQNKIFDLNGDGKISAGEFRKWSKRKIE